MGLQRVRFNWVTEQQPVFLPRKSHGHRSLAGYRPWGRKELDMAQQLNNNNKAEGAWGIGVWPICNSDSIVVELMNEQMNKLEMSELNLLFVCSKLDSSLIYCISIPSCFYLFFLFFAGLCGLWDLSSLTGDWAHAVSSDSTESLPLDHQGVPCCFILKFFLPVLLRYNWHRVLCTLTVHSVMVWLTYVMKWLSQ